MEIKNVGDSYFQRIARRDEPFDLAMDGWASDYPDLIDALGLLDGRTIREELNTNPRSSTIPPITAGWTRREPAVP